MRDFMAHAYLKDYFRTRWTVVGSTSVLASEDPRETVDISLLKCVPETATHSRPIRLYATAFLGLSHERQSGWLAYS